MTRHEHSSQFAPELARINSTWRANQKALYRIAEMGGLPPATLRYIIKPGEAWVCPDPEKLYSEMERAYHVTGLQALENMVLADKPILPSHRLFYSENKSIAVSHRGAAGYVAEDFLEKIGVNRSGAQYQVWAGPGVDNEQVIIENDIAAHPGRGSRLLFDAIFEKYSFTSIIAGRPGPLPTFYRYNVDFQKLMTHLRNGESIDDCEEVINKILYATWAATGLREGWYNYLSDLLHGIKPIPPEKHHSFEYDFQYGITGMNRQLIDKLYDEAHNPKYTKPGQAVVIPFKPKQLFGNHKVPQLVLPGDTPRDPRTIIGVDSIRFEDIDGEVYVFNPDTLPDELTTALVAHNITIKPMDDIVPSARLDPNSGFDRKPEEINPSKPMCAIRYGRKRFKRQKDYARQMKVGNLAPLYPLNLNGDDQGYLYACHALGSNVLPTNSHLFPQLNGVLSL